jgi:hypothetical protein
MTPTAIWMDDPTETPMLHGETGQPGPTVRGYHCGTHVISILPFMAIQTEVTCSV